MDQRTSNILYFISTSIFAIIFIMGAGVTYYSNFVDESTMPIVGQTIFWIMVLIGPLGIAYNIRAMKGSTPLTRKITLGVQIFVLAGCAFWLAFIYFLSEEKPDAFSQAFIWLFTVASVNRLIGILTGRHK